MRIVLALLLVGAALVPTVASGSGTLSQDVPLDHDGLTRFFDYYVPDGLPNSPVPLLFIFHGGQLDNDYVRNVSSAKEFLNLADQELFVVVIPNGTTATGETGPSGNFRWRHCRLENANLSAADDVGFVSALIDWAATSDNIDLERVYATGFSNGGLMSYSLAFELSNQIAAIGVQIQTLPVNSRCDPPANPLAVLIMNGTADPVVGWEGTPSKPNGKGAHLSAHETRDFWRSFLGTDDTPTHVDVPDIDPNDSSTVEIDLYSNGADGSEVAFYTVNGGGHRLPSITNDVDLPEVELQYGKQNHDIESAAEIWNFLEYHRLGAVAVPEPSRSVLGVTALAVLAMTARRHRPPCPEVPRPPRA